MYTIQLNYEEKMNKENNGYWKERLVACQIGGEVEHKKDKTPFYMDSDVRSLHMSVKSARFTLASGNINRGATLEEKIQDYIARTASTTVAYVTNDLLVYIMTLDEFADFMRAFCKLEKDSTKNGGAYKVKCGHESAALIEWLQARVA